MTENQRQIIQRHMFASMVGAKSYYEKLGVNTNEDSNEVLKEINESFGFDIQEQPEKIVPVIEEAIANRDASDIDYSLHLVGIAGGGQVVQGV